MNVIVFFVLVVSLIGIRVREGYGAHGLILAVSVLCATALWSFRFA